MVVGIDKLKDLGIQGMSRDDAVPMEVIIRFTDVPGQPSISPAKKFFPFQASHADIGIDVTDDVDVTIAEL
jgi:hypothetical protein